jgi:predicted AAA+ superfamily ATPase
MNEIEFIIHKAKLEKSVIKENLMQPVLQQVYKPRNFFNEIKSCADNFFKSATEPRMIGLAGLRGTGKTTLLWHTAEHIFENISQNIYFFNVETLQSLNITIFDLFKHFRYELNYSVKPIILLFDEVHVDQQWSKSLKIIYDELRYSFVVATGSSALLLQTTADLATRMLIQHIFPLQWTEYLSITQNISDETISNIQKKLHSLLFFSENIEEIETKIQEISSEFKGYNSKIENTEKTLDNYIKYHNIARFCAFTNKSYISSELKELYRRVIHEDIPKIAIRDFKYLNSEKILLRLSASDEINIQTLSQTIGISQDEINENIDILVKAELLNVLYPFGGINTKLNKSKKAFFMSPSIRLSLLAQLYNDEIDADFLSKLYEDIIVMYLKRLFSDSILSFSSFTKEKNPDFIIATRDKPVLLEVGINKKSDKQITKSKIEYRYGIVINTKAEEIEIKDKTIILPLKIFLLL